MRNMFTVLFLALFMATTFVCCKKSTDKSKDTVLALARTQYSCDKAELVRYQRGDWAIIDVCGTKRFYEWGRWCEECSFSWRERKIKNEQK